ncbi:hypothetical protein A2U01_0077472, partial [Trifolium medium]|nr:hypothetical protein [Trifolium medium]
AIASSKTLGAENWAFSAFRHLAPRRAAPRALALFKAVLVSAISAARQVGCASRRHWSQVDFC